jgi:hypothetical protein
VLSPVVGSVEEIQIVAKPYDLPHHDLSAQPLGEQFHDVANEDRMIGARAGAQVGRYSIARVFYQHAPSLGERIRHRQWVTSVARRTSVPHSGHEHAFVRRKVPTTAVNSCWLRDYPDFQECRLDILMLPDTIVRSQRWGVLGRGRAMLFSFGVLLILCGFAIMTFGLFLFYAWLPILYGLFGFDIGLLLGEWLSGEVGLFAFIFGIIGAVVLFCATYSLEPYRRVLIGFSGGALLTLSLAYLLGLDHLIGGFFGTALVVAGGLIGAIIVPQVFDSIFIAVSAFGGATMAMTGAHLLLPGVGLFDRFAGGFPPRLVTIVLTAIGIGWQFRHIEKRVQSQPTLAGVPAKSNQAGPTIP